MQKKTFWQSFSLLPCFLFFCSQQGQAQRPGGGSPPKICSIEGRVLDAQSKRPVEFATVSLMRLRDSSIVSGHSTDEEGRFVLEELPPGKMFLRIDFLGYASHTIEEISLRPDKPKLKLDDIMLGSTDAELDIAEVVAEQPTMRMAIDRKIFDVERSALAAGGTALDALKNLPMLQVDSEGNIFLRGQAVNVLIDGRPINVTGEDRRALLEQIPASMIKNVEVITSPSAKYDPEGVGGLINIVLKKNKLEGFSGTISGTVGTIFDKYSGSASLNIRQRKWNAGISYSYNYNQTWSEMRNSRTLSLPNDASSRLEQARRGDNIRDYHFVRLNAEYNFTDKTSWSLSGGVGPGGRGRRGELFYDNFDGQDAWLSSFSRADTIQREGFWSFGTMALKHKFDDEGHELDFSVQTRLFGGVNEELYSQYDNFLNRERIDFEPVSRERVNSENLGGFVSAMLDYMRPGKQKKGKLELGSKLTYRFRDNLFLAENLVNDVFVYDSLRSNDFSYDEQIYAIYATYGYKFGEKWAAQGGIRLEQTFMRSELITTGETFNNDYFSWFPSLHLTYKPSVQHAFQGSFSRRIERPNGWRLNPFPSYSDPLNLRQGNPFLRPEFVNAAELSHNYYSKKGAVSTTGFYTFATDLVTRVRTALPNDVVRNGYENLASRQTAGLEIVGSYSLIKNLRLNFSARGSYVQMDGSNLRNELDNSFWEGFFSLGLNYEWGEGWSAQGFGSFAPPSQDLQGRSFGGVYSSFALSKRIQKKWTLSMRMEDPFFAQRSNGFFIDGAIEQSNRSWSETRVFYLTVAYNFGKMEMRNRRQSGGRGSRGASGGGDEDF